jgi:acyl carrier protein
MTDTEVIELVNRSLVEEFELDPNVLTPDAHLVEDLGFDSLDFVDIAVVLQQSFGVTLREEPRVREIRTLGDLHHLIIEKKRELEGCKAPGND